MKTVTLTQEAWDTITIEVKHLLGTTLNYPFQRKSLETVHAALYTALPSPFGKLAEDPDQLTRLLMRAHNVIQSPTPKFVSMLGEAVQDVSVLLRNKDEQKG